MVSAVMIGGGPSGLATALFAARRGHSVVVLERDPPPASASDFTTWLRPGAPHSRQGHAFLARSTDVLRVEAPDVLESLLGMGAREIPLEFDRSKSIVLARRILYEAVLREAAEREPGVEIVSGVSVGSLILGRSAHGIPTVVGVRTQDHREFRSALIVDATGRRSPTPRWLRSLGLRSPEETSAEFGLFYVTRHYRLRPGEVFPSTELPIAVALDYSTVIVFPADNDLFAITVTVGIEDPYRSELRDAQAFERYLAEVPLVHPWLARAQAVDDPQPMAWAATRWRRLLAGGRPIVGGLVLLGDAALHTNPTFSRGISLAFAHAQQVAETLQRAESDPVAYVALMEQWAADNLGVWFSSQVAYDTVHRENVSRVLAGRPVARPNDAFHRYMDAVNVLQRHDPVVRECCSRVYHLLSSPKELLRNRYVLRQVNRHIKSHPMEVSRPAGPDRRGFEQLVSGGGAS